MNSHAISDLVTANIYAIVDTIDLHEATVTDDGTHVCYCRESFAVEDDWYQHVAEALVAKLKSTDTASLGVSA